MLNKIIKRPVLATVISVLITLLGILGLMKIPMSQYPEIAPPTVNVSGVYPGGNAESVLRAVITPLEEAINGVENMQFINSTAGNDGTFSISVVFEQDVNPDQAAVNVQNRAAQANAMLPAEVIKLGVNTTKQQNSTLMFVSLSSQDAQKYDEKFIENYANINIIPELKRINGIGNVMVFGNKNYSIRVWVDPIKLSSLGLIPADVEQAIANYSFESSPGKLGEESNAPMQYVLKYKGKLDRPENFEKIIIKKNNEGFVRLEDVARIELGTANYSSNNATDGNPSTVFGIIQASGSNANEVATNVLETLDRLGNDLPNGLKFDIIQNAKDRLDASLDQMKWTFIEAFILVFIIVLLFLQDFRSTIIPAIAVPVSIVGTFFFIYLIGFSINVLTLFALVLAIGIVVDDAIVVVEAVHAKMQATGLNARKATQSAMSEISGAIVSITLVMAAVFLPVGFMEGPAGVFYKQFSYTLAIAILISAVNALTLSPALCALFLKSHHEPNGEHKNFASRFALAFNASFDKFTNKYIQGVSFLGKRKIVALSLLAMVSVGAFVMMNNAQKGFVPEEDDNFLMFYSALQGGTNLQYTDAELKKITEIVKNKEQVEDLSTVSGFNIFTNASAPNASFGFIKLKTPSERGDNDNINDILNEIQVEVSAAIDGEFAIFRSPAVEGFGNAGGIDLILQDKNASNLSVFEEKSNQVISALNAQPEIAMAFTTFSNNVPQYVVEVDEDKVAQLDLTPKEVMDAVQSFLGGNQIVDFVRFGKIYRVNVKAEGEFRKDEQALSNFYVRNPHNEMISLGTLVKLKKIFGSETISRYNLYNSISVNVTPSPGYSTGKVMEVIDQVIAQELPKGYGYEYSGLSRQEQKSGGQMTLIFAISIVFVYFILAAQYESYILPLAVMLSIPTGILGVFIAIGFADLDNNIYVQIAMIMLVGLLAKNAILIVEFALQSRKNGMTIFDSAIEAARLRLRPILMTSFAFIAGLTPLMFATGGAAMGNKSISISAAGGMLIGTILGLFIIPVLFIVFQSLQEKISNKLTIAQDDEE